MGYFQEGFLVRSGAQNFTQFYVNIGADPIIRPY